jgi:hypothetical protein
VPQELLPQAGYLDKQAWRIAKILNDSHFRLGGLESMLLLVTLINPFHKAKMSSRHPFRFR